MFSKKKKSTIKLLSLWTLDMEVMALNVALNSFDAFEKTNMTFFCP